MGNPAYELIALIGTWADDGSLLRVRGGGYGDEDDPAFWDAQKKAMLFLSQIEEFLRADGSYELYEPALIEVWQYLLPPDIAWNNPAVELPMLSKGSIAFIRQVGQRIQDSSVTIASLPTEHLHAVREALLEASEHLRGLSELPANERDYILDLIGEALRLLDDDTTLVTVARAKAYEVAGASLPLLPKLSEEGRDKFGRAVFRVAGSWISDATSGAAGELLAAGAPAIVAGLLGS